MKEHNPTLKSWLKDGATLMGLDEDARKNIKAKSEALLDDAARDFQKDLETIETGVKRFEEKATAGLAKLREKMAK